MVTLGRITATQGKNGELKLRLADDHLLDLLKTPIVYIGKNNKFTDFRVESLAARRGVVVIKLAGVNDLSRAEDLKGLEVQVPEESLKTLERDSYYAHQLVGCSVLDRERTRIGSVTDVMETGGGILLVLDREGREVLIPFHRSICLDIDPGKKEIIVDPPEGLLELNEI